MRHGEYRQPLGVPSAHLLQPLTDCGELQARQAAAGLVATARAHGCVLDPVIDCSELLRAWQTATLLAEALAEEVGSGFQVAATDALVERGLGAAANLTLQEIEELLREDPRVGPLPREWKASPEFRLPVPGAETLLEAGARVARHLETRMRSLAEAETRPVLKIFVGHGAAFRFAAVALGTLSLPGVARLSMHHAGPVYLQRMGEGDWTHLAGEWKKRGDPGLAAD